MKSAAQTTKFLLVLFAIILGIVIIVNLFLPGTFPQLEGFKEGNKSRATVSDQTSGKTSCKTFSDVDKWFEGKSINDTKGFFNDKTGAIITKPTFPPAFKIPNAKDTSCHNYIAFKSKGLMSPATAPAPAEPPAAPPAAGSPPAGDAKAALLQANQAITTALAAL